MGEAFCGRFQQWTPGSICVVGLAIQSFSKSCACQGTSPSVAIQRGEELNLVLNGLQSEITYTWLRFP